MYHLLGLSCGLDKNTQLKSMDFCIFVPGFTKRLTLKIMACRNIRIGLIAQAITELVAFLMLNEHVLQMYHYYRCTQSSTCKINHIHVYDILV